MSETTSRRRPAASAPAPVETTEAPVTSGGAIFVSDFLDLGAPPTIKRAGGVGKPSVYPFKTLEVGKSFVVPLEQEKMLKRAAVTAMRAFDVATGETKTHKGKEIAAKRHTRRFIVARLTDAHYAALPKEVQKQLPGGAVGAWRVE